MWQRCPRDGTFSVDRTDLERSHGNPLLGAFVADRFGLIGICGFGGSATVFEAWDEETRSSAAVKLVRFDAGCASARHALRNDWNASTELAEITGVPAARSFFDGSVGGVAFSAFARDLVPQLIGPPGSADLVGWARVLHTAHGLGRVHGDVAPSHLMAGAIIDWGSSSTLDAVAPALGFHSRFASPELRRGEPASASSDWFGLAASVAAMATPDLVAVLGIEGMLDPEAGRRVDAAMAWMAAHR